MKNHTGKRRFTIKLLSLMFLMVQEISILQALPQRGTSNEPPTSAGNMAREASDDAKAAKTLPRKVDDTNRNGPQKTNPSTSIRTTTKEEIKDDSVKFPTNRPSNGANANQPVSVTRNKIVDEIALDPRDMKKCQQNFRDCEKLNYYPINVVEKLLSEGKINKNLLVNEVIKMQIDTRLEGSGDDGSGKKQFCAYKEEIIYPDAGKNKDGEYRFIVQLPKFNITQGIRTETCVSRGDNSCGGLKTHLPSYYQLECVQKYAYKQVVTFSSTGSVQEPIEIPSCCVCMYSDKK